MIVTSNGVTIELTASEQVNIRILLEHYFRDGGPATLPSVGETGRELLAQLESASGR